MPTPAYLDLSLYLPAGGVNGFEVNGFAVNGVGFVDSPFAGVTFVLDPYRSILLDQRDESDVNAILPSLLASDDRVSIQRVEALASEVWDGRVESEIQHQRQDSSITTDVVSLALEVDCVSFVPVEYRTAYVLANYSTAPPISRRDSGVDKLPASQEPDQTEVSYVPAEDRTTKVPR